MSFVDIVGLTQEEFVLLLRTLCVKGYTCLFICFWRTTGTSLAMEEILYVPVADDLFQDGVLGIPRGIVPLGTDLSPHSSRVLSLKEEISFSATWKLYLKSLLASAQKCHALLYQRAVKSLSCGKY